jgi:hypothetical protein
VLDASLFGPADASLDVSQQPSRRSACIPSSALVVKVTNLWAEDACETIWGCCADYNLRVWSGVEGRPLRFIKGHDDAITCIDGQSSGTVQNVTLVATGSADKTIRIFDVRAKKPLVFLFKGHTDSVLSVRLADGGRTVISGSKDKTVKLFDTRTGRLRVSLEKHFGAVSCVRLAHGIQLSKDDSGVSGFVTGGRDSMMNVWSLGGENIAALPAHRGTLTRISNMSGGPSPTFVTTGADAVVKVWDARRMRLLGEVKTGSVSDILCQPNAFVSTASTGMVKLWTLPALPESRAAREWTGHELGQVGSACTDLVASSDYVAVASKNGQIFRWAASN